MHLIYDSTLILQRITCPHRHNLHTPLMVAESRDLDPGQLARLQDRSGRRHLHLAPIDSDVELLHLENTFEPCRYIIGIEYAHS